MYEPKKNSVLIVDDETSNIIALTHILQKEYNIYATKSGAAAIKAAQKFLPEVILLDILMPDMDGYAVLATLKNSEKTQNIPVIFISGLSAPEDEEKGLIFGAADYITKPFSPALVKLRIFNQIKLIEQFRSNEYDIMKYKLANDALNIGLWDFDFQMSNGEITPDSRFTWSQEFRHMLGFSDEQDFPNLLHSLSSRMYPEDHQWVRNALAAHLHDITGKTPYDVEYRVKVKNGEYRHFHALGTTLRDRAGAPVRVAGTLMDITEKKQMERDIAEAVVKIEADAHWYRSIIDAIPHPVTVTDENMNCTFLNKAFEDFTGITREDMLGKPCSRSGFEICNTDNCVIAKAKLGVKRAFFNHGDLSCQADAEILKNLEGEISGFIVILQDITEIQQLAKEKSEAEATSQAKTKFLARMSHEIRTPMNAILGITEIMLQNEALTEEINDGLSRIRNSSDMLLGIIDDILDLSKIKAGKLNIMPAQYSVASLINDSAHLNILWVSDKPIEFEMQIDENIPSKLIGDELRIKQVLNNLLSNAFKYTEAGKVTLTAAIEPGEDSVALVFSVRDTGQGMTRAQLAKLFDEYSRFHQGTTQAIEGTGLGLSITRHLLNLMGGNIHVESEPGRGSLFTVRLPQGKVDTDTLGKELTESLQQFRLRCMASEKRGKFIRDPMPYGNVLIVDDMETNLYVAVGLMKFYGLKIDTAMSGFEAIEKIKGGNVYDVVFMDHMMPKMDGMETTRNLRGLGYANPIVALTANAVAGQADIFMQSGFDAYIAKPIDIGILDSILNKLVRDKQPAHVIEAARRQVGGPMENGGGQPLLAESYSATVRMLNKEIAGLDMARGLEKFGGNEEIYLKILRSYAASVRLKLDTMETVSENQLVDYKIAVHGIKGASFDIFAEQLGEQAEALEKAAKDGDLDYINNHNPTFLEAGWKLVSALEDMLSAINAANPKPKKDKPDGEALAKLLKACVSYDLDEVDLAMAEIDAYQYDSDGGLADWLRENVDMMNFAQIAKTLSQTK